jgi:hypothetical protein
MRYYCYMVTDTVRERTAPGELNIAFSPHTGGLQ